MSIIVASLQDSRVVFRIFIAPLRFSFHTSSYFALYGELAVVESMALPQGKQSNELRTTHVPGPAHMSEFEQRCSYPWRKQGRSCCIDGVTI